MIINYKDFLFESMISESTVVYSDKFRKLINGIDSPVAKALIEIESKDLNVTNNYIDISDKELISFIPDRKAQDILNPANAEKNVIYDGDGGILTHSPSNNNIFNLLDYTPLESGMYKPPIGTVGEVISKAVGPSSGKTYLKIKFPDGISVINKDKVRQQDVSLLPFTKNRQTVRTGRGIKGLLSAGEFKFKESEIEKFINLYKSEIDKMNDIFRKFDLVKGDDIAYWYNFEKYEKQRGLGTGTLGSSCMCAVPSNYFQIYTRNTDVCQLLILKNDDGDKIKGRALVWKLKKPDGVTYMDRIYTHNDSDVELFRQYAKSKGWYYKPENNHRPTNDMVNSEGNVIEMGTIFVQLGDYSYSKYPYLDTLKAYNAIQQTLSTEDDNSGDCLILEDTGGGYLNNDECDFCGGEGRVDCGNCDGRGEINCNTCDGDGELDCGNCDGDGEVECSTCDGDGEVKCSTCDGSGNDDDGNKCHNCKGTGKKSCQSCDESGQIKCRECRGKGKGECDDCSGKGEYECDECNGNGRVDCPECG